jgi:hypothetical protein
MNGLMEQGQRANAERSSPASLMVMPHEFERRLLAAAAAGGVPPWKR